MAAGFMLGAQHSVQWITIGDGEFFLTFTLDYNLSKFNGLEP